MYIHKEFFEQPCVQDGELQDRNRIWPLVGWSQPWAARFWNALGNVAGKIVPVVLFVTNLCLSLHPETFRGLSEKLFDQPSSNPHHECTNTSSCTFLVNGYRAKQSETGCEREREREIGRNKRDSLSLDKRRDSFSLGKRSLSVFL